MIMTIRECEEMDVNPCSCGEYPKFVQRDIHYTDIWLECPKCGKCTRNTGGYHYAMEIPLEKANCKTQNTLASLLILKMLHQVIKIISQKKNLQIKLTHLVAHRLD